MKNSVYGRLLVNLVRSFCKVFFNEFYRKVFMVLMRFEIFVLKWFLVIRFLDLISLNVILIWSGKIKEWYCFVVNVRKNMFYI